MNHNLIATGYFRDFLEGTKREDERTRLVEWDNISWKFGCCSVIIPPNLVDGLFLSDDLKSIYHRENLALKIFTKNSYNLNIPISDVTWGNPELPTFKNNLIECSKIQNIYAMHNLAPRVYDVGFLVLDDIKYPFQVTDYLEDKEAFDVQTLVKIRQLSKDLGILMNDADNTQHIIDNKSTDFQNCQFENYYEGFVERMKTGLSYGGETDIPYQDIPELDIKGQRFNKEREKLLKIENLGLPNNFTVMDFGCNGGYFLRRAMDIGASYAVGVDIPRVNEAASELNNYLGYFNMDFVDKVPDMNFDCVLLLSAFGYAKVEEIFPKAKIAYIEGHCLNQQHTEEYYRNMMAPYFTQVVTLGWTKDDPNLPPRVVMKGVK